MSSAVTDDDDSSSSSSSTVGDFDVSTAPTALRLDALVASRLSCSRAIAQQLIRAGHVSVNGAVTAKCSLKPAANANIGVNEAEANALTSRAAEISALVAAPEAESDVAFDVVHEDDAVIVIDKPYDLTVHPATSGDAATGTLVNGLLHRFGAATLSRGSEPSRPGIVHRLDRHTSGLMVVARTDAAHEHLAKQFTSRTVDKRYQAIVVGKPNSDDGAIAGIPRSSEWKRIERAIGHSTDGTTRMVANLRDDKTGKHAVTEYRIARCWRVRNTTTFYSMLDIRLLTGRTHQIRVHLSAIATPIVGDPVYSRQSNKHRVLDEEARTHLMLASTHLAFIHPTTGKRTSFDAKLPPHMQRLVDTFDSSLDLVVGATEPAIPAPAPAVAAKAGPRVVVPKGAVKPAPKQKQQRNAKRDTDKMVDDDDISL